MNKIPTAKEFIESCKVYDLSGVISIKDTIEIMAEFTTRHVQEALKQASEKANWNCISEDSYPGDLRNYDFCERDNDGDKTQIHNILINKDSILNAYDLNNIK